MDLSTVALDDLVNGYERVNDTYCCLFCEAAYEEQQVYALGEQFFTAQGMINRHICEVHHSSFDALLALDKKVTGLSDVQMEMMRHFYEGAPDKEIVAASSVTSVSTVRQHRFKLREKEKQAKVFLALMQLLKSPVHDAIHKGAKQVDERYSTTTQEREKVLMSYFTEGVEGRITTIPSKEKKKLIILQQIVQRFDKEQTYTEAQVNEVLKTVYADYVSLRRHLIEYGFMERSADGAVYRVKR